MGRSDDISTARNQAQATRAAAVAIKPTPSQALRPSCSPSSTTASKATSTTLSLSIAATSLRSQLQGAVVAVQGHAGHQAGEHQSPQAERSEVPQALPGELAAGQQQQSQHDGQRDGSKERGQARINPLHSHLDQYSGERCRKCRSSGPQLPGLHGGSSKGQALEGKGAWLVCMGPRGYSSSHVGPCLCTI